MGSSAQRLHNEHRDDAGRPRFGMAPELLTPASSPEDSIAATEDKSGSACAGALRFAPDPDDFAEALLGMAFAWILAIGILTKRSKLPRASWQVVASQSRQTAAGSTLGAHGPTDTHRSNNNATRRRVRTHAGTSMATRCRRCCSQLAQPLATLTLFLLRPAIYMNPMG